MLRTPLMTLLLLATGCGHAQAPPQGAGGVPCPGMPTVSYEGETYNTVQIGDRCWLRENLNIGTMLPGRQDATDNGVIEKHCYGDSRANCDAYGGLYNWHEAMLHGTGEEARGICPDGWHVPALAEAQALASTAGGDGNALKAVGQGAGAGAGTNTTGFTALLAGHGSFANLTQTAYFWTATASDVTWAAYWSLFDTSNRITVSYNRKYYPYSVRCVRD